MTFKKKKTRKRPWYSRRKTHRRHGHGPLPILPLIGLAPPIYNVVEWVKDPIAKGDFAGAFYNGSYSLLKDFAGYDLNQKKWTGGNMLTTYSSLLAGYVGHVLANKIGINRNLKRVPIVGKWVQL